MDAPLTVMVAELPEHTVAEFAVSVGLAITVTCEVAVLTQPSEEVAVTV